MQIWKNSSNQSEPLAIVLIWRFFLFLRLKVLNINTIESGLKVECQMETAKQKTITFEFSTVDFVPEDISNEFVKEVIIYHDFGCGVSILGIQN